MAPEAPGSEVQVFSPRLFKIKWAAKSIIYSPFLLRNKIRNKVCQDSTPFNVHFHSDYLTKFGRKILQKITGRLALPPAPEIWVEFFPRKSWRDSIHIEIGRAHV